MRPPIPREVEGRLTGVLQERLDDLSLRIETWLAEARTGAGSIGEALARALGESLEALPAAATAAAPRRSGLEPLARLAATVQAESDQARLIGQVMEAAASLAPRAILFALRQDTLVGWAGAGLPAGLNPRALTAPLGGEDVLARSVAACAGVRRTASETGREDPLAARLGLPPHGEAVAAPLWIKNRVAAVLYADTGDAPAGEAVWCPQGIEVLATMAALALESLPLRARAARPARTGIDRGSAAQGGGTEAVAGATSPVAVTGAAHAAAPAPPPAEDPAAMEARHLREEARRFARLMASEIVLYNQQEIEEGRRSKDLYQRLKESLERSRRMFEQRFGSRVPGAAGLLHEELVAVVAEGDESALRLPWP